MNRAAAAAIVAAIAGGCDVVFPPATLSPDAAFDTSTCPSEYDNVTGAASRYRYIDTVMAGWVQAEAACAVPGIAHLVVFDGYPELAAVRAGAPWGAPWVAWVGYARNPSDAVDHFTAVTGEPLSPVSSLWEPGEPEGASEYAVWVEDARELSDAPHDEPVWMICECDGRSTTATFALP